MRCLQFCIASRTWFEVFEKQDPKTLSDIQRAARFFYLQKNCYGGRVKSQNFVLSAQKGSNYNPHTIPMHLHLAHERLLNVQLECLPYQEILKKYDRPFAFFYLDPPYLGLPYYKFNFGEKDFLELAKELNALKGKFLLSLNDRPEIRKIFSDFEVAELSVTYSSHPQQDRVFKEVLIANFSLPPTVV